MTQDTGEPTAGPSAAGTPVLLEDVPPRPPAQPAPGAGRRPGERRWIAGLFIGPAAIFLGAIVLYPMVYSLVRSLFHNGPTGEMTSFAGLSNYVDIFTDDASLQALENNIVWVVVVPALVTILGLIFAVLTERIRWAAAFKVVLFMPMAISFLASGVTWSLIYVDQPSQGLGNAVVTGIHDVFSPSSSYPNLHTTSANQVLTGSDTSGFATRAPVSAGSTTLLPLVGLDLRNPPADAEQAATPNGGGSGVSGVVWNDFKLGGGGTPGTVDPGEVGVPGLTIQAVRDGQVVASTQTGADGTFRFTDLGSGSYQLRLPASDFAPPFNGYSWLGKNLITPAIILVYLWIYAGFAMVLLAAGMAAIPREALEAARMDGATEWQVFRRITAPLLSPVLMVVFITMVINVLKVFDIVFVIQQAAGSTAKYANVLAVQLYTEYGNQKFGEASAIGIALVILVIPAMIFQIRRFRKESR